MKIEIRLNKAAATSQGWPYSKKFREFLDNFTPMIPAGHLHWKVTEEKTVDKVAVLCFSAHYTTINHTAGGIE